MLRTIEMFEIIVQSQPDDVGSLEILKEAYSRLDRVDDLVDTTKRMAKAYEGKGQLTSAILEYEGILELRPEDPDVRTALARLNRQAESFAERLTSPEPEPTPKPPAEPAKPDILELPKALRTAPAGEGRDGRERMRKLFVEGRHVSGETFDECWTASLLPAKPGAVADPFIQVLANRSLVPLDQSLRLLCEEARLCYVALDRYDVDLEWVRQFPREVCRRWCLLPFDHMSKSLLVATANPWNPQAAEELKAGKTARLIWYLASPPELAQVLRRAFR